MTKLRKITAAASAIAVLGAGGLTATQAATAASDSGTTSSAAGHPGPRGGGGPMMNTAQLDAIAKTLGVTTAQLKAALDATKPAKGDKPDGDGMATELAAALGVDVAKIKTILDANRPAKPAAGTKPAAGSKPPAKPAGARPPKPDNSKLVTALATGLGIDEATVKAAFDKIDAAHQADHATQDAAKYAAIASKLGVSADAVKAAFEANRPAHAGPPPAA
jgi:hypothetical protein